MRLKYPNKLSEEELKEEVVPADLSRKWRIVLGNEGQCSHGRLLYGDNLPILRRLAEDSDVVGKVRLIYIDPPFATGRAFATRDGRVAYHDVLVGHEFLEFLRRRLILLRELLADDGSLYVHIDSTIGHYVKVLLDEVFGSSCFRNDISRIKCNPKNFDRKAYGNFKDTILFYSRKPASVLEDPLLFNDHRAPLTEAELNKQFPKVDPEGRRYATTPLHAPGETRNGPTGREWKGLLPPEGRHWRYPPEELTRLDEAGLVQWSRTGNPRKIIFAEDNKGKKVQDVWEYKDRGAERASYPTEKNLNLLRFIISNSSAPGDLVLDAFAGSGTTLLAANELGRSWIGIEASPLGMSVCQSRLAGSSLAGGNGTDFVVSEARVVPEQLAEPVRMNYRVLEPTSLLSEEVRVEVDLGEGSSGQDRGEIVAVLIDPDFDGDLPQLRKGFVHTSKQSSREHLNKVILSVPKIGERIFVLVLHKTGEETVGLARNEQYAAR